MKLEKKLEILTMAAKYDSSCASNGSTRQNSPGGIGNAAYSGICHSWSNDGRCISLLKILLTNDCVYNCAYCINKSSNDHERATFTPEEVADLTIKFYTRNYIEGLFLSSAVYRNVDYTMELIYKTLKLLRYKYKFNGYIHIKAMPGADEILLNKACLLADRVSANIELPSQKSLSLLAPQKNKKSILNAMSTIKQNINEYGTGIINSYPKKRTFAPAGQSTQLIVGATQENDRTILNLSESLYKHFSLKRVYYSAYIPVVTNDNRLPITQPPLKRENRLYQADWLLRFYGFKAGEILSEKYPNFDPDLDPKSFWAICNMHLFPVEINKAEYELLIRVPGIGIKSALRIVKMRKVAHIGFDELRKIGVVLKRARYFITCKGIHLEKYDYDLNSLKNFLLSRSNTFSASYSRQAKQGQLFLFNNNLLPDSESRLSAINGQL